MEINFTGWVWVYFSDLLIKRPLLISVTLHFFINISQILYIYLSCWRVLASVGIPQRKVATRFINLVTTSFFHAELQWIHMSGEFTCPSHQQHLDSLAESTLKPALLWTDSWLFLALSHHNMLLCCSSRGLCRALLFHFCLHLILVQ